jgi:hypothetical protein
MRDTIDMAREVYGAHTEWTGAPLDRLEQLVALVRADEREQALAAPVQPVAWAIYQQGRLQSFWLDKGDAYDFEFTTEHQWQPLYTTPPAAQPAPVQPVAWVEYETGNHTKRPQNCGTGYCSCIECVMKPAVPDAFGTRDGEHPQYIQGWNDCRAETLKMRKP